MGIRGLLTYCLERPREVADQYDIVKTAAGRDSPLELAVDYNHFVYVVLEHCKDWIYQDIRKTEPAFILAQVGQYDIVDDIVERYIRVLRQCNIEFVFFDDGPKGGDRLQTSSKFSTWVSRQKQRVDLALEIEKICKGKRKYSTDMENLLPILIGDQIVLTIQRLGCKIFYCHGEADCFIGNYLQQHRKVFAVIGNDSDFCVIKGCRFIPSAWFFKGEDLTRFFKSRIKSRMKTLRLDKLEVRVIKTEKIVASLALNDHSHLVNFAILRGNDFTSSFVGSLPHNLGIRRDFTTLLDWFRANISLATSLQKCQKLSTVLNWKKQFTDAIKYSEDFYNLRLQEKPLSNTRLGVYLDKQAGCGILPSKVYAWYNGIHWWSPNAIEDSSIDKTCIGTALQELRSYLYSMVRERNESKPVLEYGKKSEKNPSSISAKVFCKANTSLPLAYEVARQSIDERKILFDRIASHFEEESSETRDRRLKCYHSFFEQFKKKEAFICYIMNYLLTLDGRGRDNLDLTDREIIAILLSSFVSLKQKPTSHLSQSIPSIRCLTLGTWIQSVCQYVSYLARLCLIAEDFPEPREVFIGRHFTWVYTQLEQHGFEAVDITLKVRLHLVAIIKENNFIPNERKIRLFRAIGQEIINPQKATVGGGSLVQHKVEVTMGEIWDDDDLLQQDDSEVPGEWEYRLTDDIETRREEEQKLNSDVEGELETTRTDEPADELEYQADDHVINEAHRILPIMAFRRQILEKILNHRVTCIRGETGCGKSTMVPQFIMEDADSNPSKYPRPVSIVVTQPRRLAAQTLAQRVAQTRMEEVGKTVGYRIGQDSCCSKDTKLIYVTTGHLLQSLVNNPKSFRRYTHVILDEVHLREMDNDLLSLMIKLLSDDIHEQVKIVVMSASIDGDMFPRYFDPDYDVEDSLLVGTKCFPVEMIYLEDLNHYFGNTLLVHQKLNILKAVGFYNKTPLKFYIDQSIDSKSEEDDDEDDFTWEDSPRACKSIHDLLIEMISKKHLDFNDLTKMPKTLDSTICNELCVAVVRACARAGESVLIFVPGRSEIEELFDMLIDYEKPGKPGWGCPIRLFALHSLIPLEDQIGAFDSPSPDVTHVLLATDIAENSLTLPNVRIVIDFGFQKQAVYNTEKRVNTLEKVCCSKVSCEQRAGRAGRVFKGRCIRLYTRDHFEELKECNEPEMATSSLAKCVLSVKHIGKHFSDYTPHELLQQAIEPPCTENFDEAVQTLADMGAIKENDEQSDMTLLGVVALNLPTDLRLSRLVLYGVLFNCACDAIVMAAALQAKDPFTLPTKLIIKDDQKFRHSVEKSFHYRSLFDEGQYNEPLMYRNLMIEWLCFVARYLPSDDYPVTDRRRSRQQRMCFSVSEARDEFCRRHAVVPKRFLVFENTVRRLASSTVEMIPKEHESRKKINTLIKLLKSEYARRKGSGIAPLQEDWAVRNPSELFTQDTWVINAVLCAAFNPAIMEGITTKHAKTKQGDDDDVVRMEAGMRKSGVDPRRSVFLGVPEELLKQPTVLKKLIHTICDPVKEERYDNTNAVLEFREDSKNSVNYRPVIYDLPTDAHAVNLFSENRPRFPVQLSAADAACIGVEDSSHISLTAPKQPYRIKWSMMSWGGKRLKQGEKVFKASCHWRNPIGFACDTEKCTHYGMTYSFAARGRSGLAEGVSVLPSENDNLKAIALLLTFQPAQFGVSFKVSGQESRILSAEMFQYNLEFSRKCPLTPRLLQSINELRAKISHVFDDDEACRRKIIPDAYLHVYLRNLLKKATVPTVSISDQTDETARLPRDGRHRETDSLRSSKDHHGEPVKISDVTSVITGNSVENKPDLIFRVDAFEKQPEKCDTSDFTLLKPYDVQALEHVFVRAKQILSNCNESQVSDDSEDDGNDIADQDLKQRLCDSLIVHLLKRQNKPQKVKEVLAVNKNDASVFYECVDEESAFFFFISDFSQYFEVLPYELTSNTEFCLSREFYFDPLRDRDMSSTNQKASSNKRSKKGKKILVTPTFSLSDNNNDPLKHIAKKNEDTTSRRGDVEDLEGVHSTSNDCKLTDMKPTGMATEKSTNQKASSNKRSKKAKTRLVTPIFSLCDNNNDPLKHIAKKNEDTTSRRGDVEDVEGVHSTSNDCKLTDMKPTGMATEKSTNQKASSNKRSKKAKKRLVTPIFSLSDNNNDPLKHIAKKNEDTTSRRGDVEDVEGVHSTSNDYKLTDMKPTGMVTEKSTNQKASSNKRRKKAKKRLVTPIFSLSDNNNDPLKHIAKKNEDTTSRRGDVEDVEGVHSMKAIRLTTDQGNYSKPRSFQSQELNGNTTRANQRKDRLGYALTYYLNSYNHVARSIRNAAAKENTKIVRCLKELEPELFRSAGPEAVLLEFLSGRHDFEILEDPFGLKFRLIKIETGALVKDTKSAETRCEDKVAFRKGVSSPPSVRAEQNDKRPKKVSRLDDVLKEKTMNYLREHPGQQPLTTITSNRDVDDARKMLSKNLATFGSEFTWKKFLLPHRNVFDIRGLDEHGSLKNVSMSLNLLSKMSNASCEDPASKTHVSSATLDVPKTEPMETTKPTSTKSSSDVSAAKEASPPMRKVTENLSVQEIDLVKEILQFLKSHQRANSLDDLQKVKRIQTASGRLQQSLGKFNRTFDWKIFLSLFQRLGVLDVTNLRANSRGVKISCKEGCLQVLSTMCKRSTKDTVSRYNRVRLNLDDVYVGRKKSQQMLHTTSENWDLSEVDVGDSEIIDETTD